MQPFVHLSIGFCLCAALHNGRSIGIHWVTLFRVKTSSIIRRLSKNIWKNKNQVYILLFDLISVYHKLLKS